MSASQGLRRAKRMLHKRCKEFDWYAGVGIVPATHGPGLRITARRKPGKDEVPALYYGFPVEIVVVKEFLPRDLRR